MKKGMRLCKCGCGASIAHKHVNALFLNAKHKDRYWNEVNPRGKFAHLADMPRRDDPYPDDNRHIFDLED